MKKFKIISNVITILILVTGLVPCIGAYVDHTMNCTGCSMHAGHPTVELMIYSLVILFAGTMFCISRIILWLNNNKILPDDKKVSFKFLKPINILILAILSFGIIHSVCMFIVQFSGSFSHTLIDAETQFLYLIPYVLVAAIIFGISRLVLLIKTNLRKERIKK